MSESNAYMERLAGTYGWVFGQIRVDPTDENTVYVDGPRAERVEGRRQDVPAAARHARRPPRAVDRPGQPEATWSTATTAAWWCPTTRGRTWRQFLDNLPAVQFFNVSYDMDTPFHVYGSIQDHGSRRGGGRPEPRARSRAGRRRSRTRRAARAAATRSTRATRASCTRPASTTTSTAPTSRRSTRGGRPQATSITPRLGPADGYLRGQWLSPIVLSAHNPDVVYFGGQYVFRSWNRGDTWEKISADLSYNDPKQLGDIPYQTIFALSESPMRFGLLYAGTDDGRLHVTKDGGKTWTEITKGLQPKRWISKVVASAFDEGTVYVTQNGKRDDDFTAVHLEVDRLRRHLEEHRRQHPARARST